MRMRRGRGLEAEDGIILLLFAAAARLSPTAAISLVPTAPALVTEHLLYSPSSPCFYYPFSSLVFLYSPCSPYV